jgi:diguanylate cyclase (GGDEF)-like protein
VWLVALWIYGDFTRWKRAKASSEVTALALWGSGFITASVATTLIIVLRGTIPNFWSIIVGNALLSAAYGILWSGARKFEAKKVSILLALVGVSVWLVACSIGPIYARPEARATVMAAIGIVYALLVVFELWRGRGDQVWRWPIMALLLAHAAAVPIHIPLAWAWTHPDPSDPSDLDLLTFAVFEGAFVCICAAYLFGGLAKDRIAARYRRASVTDPLTGAANRRGFFERGERLLMRARFARERTALILFDLDRFKIINDRYGHLTGDEVLTAFSRLATSHLRPNDLFGRIGGEEFASLLPDTGQDEAIWLAERVRRAFEASSLPIGQHAIRSTVSVGVAISDEEYSDLSALLAAADRALYRAKALGRNRVEPSPHRAEQFAIQSSGLLRSIKPPGLNRPETPRNRRPSSLGSRRTSATAEPASPIRRHGRAPNTAANSLRLR